MVSKLLAWMLVLIYASVLAGGLMLAGYFMSEIIAGWATNPLGLSLAYIWVTWVLLVTVILAALLPFWVLSGDPL